MRLRQRWAGAAFLAAGAAVGVAFASFTRDPKEVRIAQLLAETLPRVHLSKMACDERMATNALEIYLSALDFDHTYFLASDVESFRRDGPTLAAKLREGDLEPAFRIYDTFLARVSNRYAFVTNLVAKGFDLASHETYAWKRRRAPWPADEKAWDDLWRRKIRHEYVGRTVARKIAAEEKAAQATNGAARAAAPATNGVPKDIDLSPEESLRKQYGNFLTVLKDNDKDFVVERYLTSFTQAYDPHSDYLSFNESEDFDISMKLSLVGIGALLTTEDGVVKVERVIKGGPAAKDGRLKAGDRIVAVAEGDGDAKDIVHMPLSKTVRLIRGKKGSKVVLSVLPASDPTGSTVTKITIVRDEVKIEEQAAKSRVESFPGPGGVTRKLGVITLPEFYADMRGSRSGREEARSASRDVLKLINELKKQDVEGIVLDIRSNGGGALNEAISLTGAFIESGPVVQVKDQRRLQIITDPDPDVAYDGPLVVLVNRLSASASEIVAGALQDWGRAVIVGDSKTHGKGTVQTLSTLSSSDDKLGSVKLTTASFYRIAGGSTQRNGVAPDIVIPSVLESMELGEEYLPNALPWSEVFQAFYRPDDRLATLLPGLKQKSEERLKADQRFQAYADLVRRLGERQKAETIPLNLDERLELARSEKQLQKLVQETDPTREADEAGDEEQDPAQKKPDLILQESLRVLSDLVAGLRVLPAPKPASMALTP